MKWLYRNAVIGASIVASSNALGYGTSLLQDRSAKTKLKFTGKDDEYVTVDFGSALPVSSVGILGHNMTDDAVITLEANTADSWLTPAFSRTLTWREYLAETFTEQTYQFWRVSIQDVTNTASLEMGVLYLGLYIDVASVAPDAEISVESNDVVSDTRSGQVYGYSMFQAYTPAFNLHHVTDEKRKELLEVWASQSQVEPFILLVWEDSLDVLRPLYVRFTMTAFRFAKVPQHGLGYTSSFSCREVF